MGTCKFLFLIFILAHCCIIPLFSYLAFLYYVKVTCKSFFYQIRHITCILCYIFLLVFTVISINSMADGAGGKGTWGKLLDTDSNTAVDRNDPNYDSGEV